ncbi:DUF3617 domain-containing protein [Candidatus Binatia bacterium]|nr:DUF3617 domain-containing protein [Candidatus Binatia bacterium]
MRTTVVILAATTAAALLAPQAPAAGLDMKPGRWQFDTKVESSMKPRPTTKSEVKCITKEAIERDPLAAIIEEGRCKVLSRKESANSLEFEIECKFDPQAKMNMRGKGVFAGSGDTASGHMDVKMAMPKIEGMPNTAPMGGNMTMRQEWTGKRLGACE